MLRVGRVSDRLEGYSNQTSFQKMLNDNGVICSMSGTGNCYDNAVAETFFHTLKTECIHFERYESREQAKQSIFEYVEIFYNNQRRHSTLGYVSPTELNAAFINHPVPRVHKSVARSHDCVEHNQGTPLNSIHLPHIQNSMIAPNCDITVCGVRLQNFYILFDFDL